ncbi:MAG: hypothetical protein E6R08_09025 [Nevskiaceae bacterium]|nr:MAG: hypothetical protein E6R08_09025 [Nevskiaceae bacterium]
MKVTWEEGDIIPGRYYYRDDSRDADLIHLATVTHKIGFMAGSDSDERYVSVSVCDGMVTGPCTKVQLAATLNAGGYVPLSSDRLVQIVGQLRAQNEGRTF